MKGIQKKKGQDLQKPFPGCIGRVVNVFDSNANIVGTKLDTERAYIDGVSVGRNRFDAVKVPIDPVTVRRDEKQIRSDLRKSYSNERSSGTPIKRLIEQEMSKEADYKQNPPNVVARLMGVDHLPVGQSDFPSRRVSKEEHPSGDLSGDYRSKLYQHHLSSHRNEEWKDVYPLRIDSSKCKSHVKERHEQNCYEKRSPVHEKFVEAKRLATREKLLHSKEFRQALQVLSSNRELFVKFLEEPNSFLSRRLHENVSPPSDMKRITVLKPSKIIEIKGKRLIDKHLYSDGEESDGDSSKHYRSSSFSSTKTRDLFEPTRIVVLKPNPRKPQEIKSMATLLASSQTSVRGRESKGVSEADEVIGSRILAKEITQQMRESLKHKLRDETSLPSIYTNKYIGEETSLHQSKHENTEERKGGDLSEWEFASSISSHHLWDYTNRIGSPCSVSSFRTAHSFESSVTLEAKKRLSERWAMVASNSCRQEQEEASRSWSTLGEMLSFPEVKKEQVAEEAIDEQEEKEYNSKSVSVSSKANKDVELYNGATHSLTSSAVVPKEVSNKSKTTKSLFSMKVSSLFFSRSKKQTRKEYNPSTSSVSNGGIFRGNELNDNLSQCIADGQSKQSSFLNSEMNFGKPYSVYCDTTDKGTTKEGIFGESQDQPSPVSVLEVPFSDDYINNVQPPSKTTIAGPPQALSRSPPIESMARSLPQDSSHLVVTSPNSLRLSRVFSKADEEQNRFMFVQKLVFSAGLERGNLGRNYVKWHSLESPLSPLLLDELSDTKLEGAKSREARSKEKLVFDSVNEALIDTAQANLLAAYPWARTHGFTDKERTANLSSSVADEVWGVVRNWSYFERYFLIEDNNSSFVVDLMIKREAAGRTWAEMNWLEMYDLNSELCKMMLEELVEEAFLDLTCL